MTIERRSFLSLLLLGAVSALPASARTGDVRIVVNAWPPFTEIQPDGTIGGTATDRVRSVMAAAGLTPRFEVLPWRRAYATALNEQDVLIYPVTRLPDREASFTWLVPLAQSPCYFYALAARDDLGGIRSLADLERYTIAAVQGDATIPLLQEYGFDTSRIVSLRDGSGPLNVVQVLKGRADFFFEVPETIPALEAELGLAAGTFRPVIALPRPLSFYLAARRDVSPILESRLREAVSDLGLPTY